MHCSKLHGYVSSPSIRATAVAAYGFPLDQQEPAMNHELRAGGDFWLSRGFQL
jgi:hypothetical protein